ncbi:hypothetical protein F5B20DRAFT_519166 [Whalleya microplaca]|nr:hypothetical protein F5B20DRAFT_519166 [Whalleya microplaca]
MFRRSVTCVGAMMIPSSWCSSPQWALRSRGGSSNPAVSHHHRSRIHMAVIFLIISCWISLTTAISLDHPPRAAETQLLIDTRIPVFLNGRWQIMSEEEHRQLLHRRAETDSAGSSTTTYEVGVSTATTVPTTTSVADGPLPSPFDGALAANFSGDDGGGSCPAFLSSLLKNSTFQSCYPISLLLKNSNSFFQAQKSLVKITQVLETACRADKTSCTNYFNNLAKTLTSDENCGQDFEKQNSLVVQTYKGMRAYAEIYSATCLSNPDTSAYCFANAVTNLTTSSNVYLYYLPLNSSLPQSAVPSCDSCTRETMNIYQAAAADRTKYVANSYVAAAEKIDSACGADFVNATLPAATEGAAGPIAQAPSLLLLSLVFMTMARWLS